MRFSFFEQSIFVLLLAASAWGFWFRFRKVIRTIQAAKPDADFELHPIAKRVRDFVWEVLLQAKVIRQRPLPGLAHAFVFWGFCAFSLVTLNHFATAVGFPFLSWLGGFGQFYFSFAALFAIMVIVSISGLFVRRFVLQPKWLGPVSCESGVIAMLIFALMITYLAGLWFGGREPGEKAMWWLHTIALLALAHPPH